MSVPAIASLAIFQFMWVWNDLLIALIFLGGSASVAPMTVTMSNMVNSYGGGWEYLTAAAFLSMALPMLVFFRAFRSTSCVVYWPDRSKATENRKGFGAMGKSNGKSVSQLEIARIAGVSRTTVSFVLNNVRGKNISEETRQRVVAAAKEFGYTPDLSAVDTATSREGAICLFVCHSESAFSDAYIMRLIEGIGPALHKSRYDLRVVQFRISRHDYLETAPARKATRGRSCSTCTRTTRA